MKESFLPWLICIILFVGIIFLGIFAYGVHKNNKTLSHDLAALQEVSVEAPSRYKVKKIDSISDGVKSLIVYKTPKIDPNDLIGKTYIIGDKKKEDSLTKLLGIKDKDILAYKETNMSLTLLNQKLLNKPESPSKYIYRDKYLTLTIDRDSMILDSLKHSLALTSISYMKAPKWYKGKEEIYALSIDDNRVNLDLKGFDTTPKVMKSSFYLDTRYNINPSDLNNNLLSSTLNYEWGMDNILSWYIGGGVQTSFKKNFYTIENNELKLNKGFFQPLINAGFKINIYRNKQ